MKKYLEKKNCLGPQSVLQADAPLLVNVGGSIALMNGVFHEYITKLNQICSEVMGYINERQATASEEISFEKHVASMALFSFLCLRVSRCV